MILYICNTLTITFCEMQNNLFHNALLTFASSEKSRGNEMEISLMSHINRLWVL